MGAEASDLGGDGEGWEEEEDASDGREVSERERDGVRCTRVVVVSEVKRSQEQEKVVLEKGSNGVGSYGMGSDGMGSDGMGSDGMGSDGMGSVGADGTSCEGVEMADSDCSVVLRGFVPGDKMTSDGSKSSTGEEHEQLKEAQVGDS